MSKFEPSERLLKEIKYGFVQIGNRHIFANQYAKISVPVFTERLFYRYVATSVVGAIKESFGVKILLDEGQFSFGQNLIGKILLEALINVAEHGKTDKEIETGYWIGAKGFILGFKDKSSFFRDPETKRLFESRTYPAREGLKWIFDEHVDVHVSNEQGALYLVLLIEKLIC